MKLSSRERKLFHKLHGGLIQFALGKAADTVLEQRDEEALIAARDSLFRNRRRITTFVKKNPFKFSPEELEIVSRWTNARFGYFYIARSLKDHTLFIESRQNYKPSGHIFGVVALDKPFKKIVSTPLPVLVRTVLLPFQEKIVFDGVMSFYAVDFGDDVRQMLDDICEYKIGTSGIITSLEGKHGRNLGTQSKAVAKRKVSTHTKKPKSK